METSRVAALLPELLRETQPVPNLLHRIREALQAGKVNAVATIRSELQEILERAPSNSFVPSWLRMIEALGARTLHGLRLMQRVDAILEQSEYRPDHKALLVEGIQAELEDRRNRLGQLQSAFEGLGITPAALPVDQCEVGVLFPAEAFGDTDDFSREIHELDRHLKTFAETAGTRGSLSLHQIETGTFNIFTLADLEAGALISLVLGGLTKLAASWAQTAKTIAETKKISAEAAAITEKTATEKRDRERKELVEAALAQSKVSDEGRRHELAISVPQAIQYLESKIEVKVIFEVRAPMPSQTDEKPMPEIEGAMDKIRELGGSMAEISERQSIALLEEPDALKEGASTDETDRVD